MKEPLVSIIIPTRNRQKYAEKTVKQILSLGLDIEIIVQDNSDDNSLQNSLSELIAANRIKYSYEKGVLPFSENYNRATELVSGEYLCAIGDDDGILPNIVQCALWMKENRIDIVKPAKSQVYFYPGNENKKKNACVGFGKYTGEYYYSNPEASVIALLNDGGCNYLEKELAGSYHGLVSMAAMRRVKEITGKYYGGLTPDMYSVVCLSLLPDIRFVIMDYPISLPGVCPTSGSAVSEAGKHVGRLEDSPHLKAFPDYVWSDLVPKYYSVETIWAETMIYAIDKMGRNELTDKYFNLKRLSAYIYSNNRLQQKDILAHFPQELADYVVRSCRNKNPEKKASRILKNAAIKLSGDRKVIRRVQDITEAVALFEKSLEKEVAPWN